MYMADASGTSNRRGADCIDDVAYFYNLSKNKCGEVGYNQ